MTNPEAEQRMAVVERAVSEAMRRHGPDGHIDGYQIIARAAIRAWQGESLDSIEAWLRAEAGDE